MTRLLLAICLAVAGASGLSAAAHPALAASLCVGSGPGCYPTIQQALSVVHNGDVIHLGTGTFPGGITINVSVSIIGAGSGVTTIQGGGPVVTIGSADVTSEPTVSITGVTITGGLNTTVPNPSQPRGGGVWVPSAADGGPGATVAMTGVAISGNRVRASQSGDCGGGCTLSVSRGGGIASFGTMTLTNSVVSNNQAIFDLSPAPDNAGAYGGGIKNNGTLTLRNSTVSGNAARFTTAAPNQTDRSGQGGGIDSNGPLTMVGSTVSDNTVSMTSTSTDGSCDLPNCGGVFGVGGGVNIQETGSGTIRDSVIRGNSITATGYTGGNGDGGGGIDADGPLLLVGSLESGNQATTISATPSAGQVSGSDGGGIEIGVPATIKDTAITDNQAAVSGDAAVVFAMGAAISNGAATVTDSTITGNTSVATTTSGVVYLEGGAIHIETGTMTLRNTTVRNNSGSASGSSGVAEGGGIYNGAATFFCPDCTSPPPHQLILDDSAITQNSVSATSQSIAVHGGGVFNDTSQQATVTAANSLISQNVPDQCYGC